MARWRFAKAWIFAVCVLLPDDVIANPGKGSLRPQRNHSSRDELVVLDEVGVGKCATAYVEDCGASGKCCDASMTCYEKHADWAACLPSCTPGVQPWVDWLWHWTPWTCMPIVHVIAQDEMGTELESSDATPLRFSASPHRYKQFANKTTKSGISIYDDAEQIRMTFVKSVHECKVLCDKDRRCDCFMYTTATQHCDKRRACTTAIHDFEDSVGKNFYVKLPNKETVEEEIRHPALLWKEFPRSNLYFSTGLRLDDEDYGSSTIKSCKRRCELSKSCQCFRFSKAFGRCERYTDCVATSLIEDELYDVYIKEEPRPQEPQDIAWWIIWQLVVLVLLLLICCLLFAFCTREQKEPQPVEYVPLLPPKKTRLDMFTDAALVERWPGCCADCGCACGRPPAWVPRSGAVVVTEAMPGNVHTRSDGGGRLVPGDVLLTMRSGGAVNAIHCTDDVKEVVGTCRVGQTIDMEVLRARTFGEYSCSRPQPDEFPHIEVTMDRPEDVEKVALPTHKKVRVLRLVE